MVFPVFLSGQLPQVVEHWTLNSSVMGLSPHIGKGITFLVTFLSRIFLLKMNTFLELNVPIIQRVNVHSLVSSVSRASDS